MMRLVAGMALMITMSKPAVAQEALELSAIRPHVELRPDSVRIGDPFSLIVRVQAPPGSRIEFPVTPDSSATYALLDPASMATTDSGAVAEETAVYRMAAWDVGTVQIGLRPARVILGGQVRDISLSVPPLHVLSVLPQAEGEPDPRPARDIFLRNPPWWWPWLPILLLLLAALGAYWYIKRRRELRASRPLAPVASALKELDTIESLGLLDAGESGRYVALSADALRHFLIARVPGVSDAQTSGELNIVLAANPQLPAPEIAELLADADRVKFASAAVETEFARAVAHRIRSVIADIGDPVEDPDELGDINNMEEEAA